MVSIPWDFPLGGTQYMESPLSYTTRFETSCRKIPSVRSRDRVEDRGTRGYGPHSCVFPEVPLPL